MGESLLVVADRVHTFGHPARAGRRSAAADAVLIRAGRVAAVGERAGLEARAGAARRLELPGSTLTPGLADAHIHPLEFALARQAVALEGADSAESAAAAVAERAGGEVGGWVRGWGWNPHDWPEPPHRAVLDARVPDRPVALTSHDMHSLWVNTAALERAGIDATTPDPAGGRIVRDARGLPTGLLRENATRLVLDRIPAPSEQDARAALLEAQAALHRLGVTAIHSVEGESFGLWEALRAADRLRLRVLQHLPVAALDSAIRIGLRSGFGGDWIRVGGIKIFLDGALGSRTAWLREPYQGAAGDRGVALWDPDEFGGVVRRAAEAGLAATVHAIGDAAVDLALDVLGSPQARGPALPHRIEHVQLCAPDRWADAARSGIVFSMQPAHLLTDWRIAERHWGRERSRGAYAFRSLSGAGGPSRAVLAFGSDAPVEPADPRLGLYAATSRQDTEGEPEDGWFPAERLTARQALWAYTVGPARAGRWPRLGRLVPGAHADLVAWDRDPLACTGPELLRMRCLATLVAGTPTFAVA